MFFIKKLTQPMDMNAPPKPQSTPEIRKETYPILFTLMPTDAAALAFSPTARSRKPSLVLVRKNQTAKIEMKARYVRTLCPESMGPISGILLISGSDKILLSELGIAEMTLETAVRLLEAKGLKAVVVEETSEDVEAGKIVRMEPEDKAALGDSVTLYVSTGPEVEVTPVPDLYGKTENEAAALLTEAGLLTGEISRAHDASVPAGQVISQGIEKDTDAELGTAVDLVVSLGPEPPKTQFLASLQVTYPLMISFGPGAESSEVQILIRLKQTVNGKVTYTKLAEPKAYSASTMLDIRLDHIRGADGVSTGEVEIVDLTNNVVLTSYNVNFVETEV